MQSISAATFSNNSISQLNSVKNAIEESMLKKTMIIKDLLKKFDHGNIPYAIIRNYRFLVENSKCIHRDFDVLISTKDYARADKIAEDMGFKNTSKNDYRKGAVWSRYMMDIPGQDRPLLIDLHRDVVREFMIPYMGEASLIRRVRRGDIVTFSDEDTFVNEVVHATITKGFIKKRYRDDMTRYIASPGFDRLYAENYLKDLFGKEDALRIMQYVSAAEFDKLLCMRKKLFNKFIMRDAKTFRIYAEFFVKNTIREILASLIKPKKAKVIALIGVDGSGKSTASEAIQNHFETYFGKKCEIVYMGRGRNRALPGARAAIGKLGVKLPVPDSIKYENPIKKKILYMARDAAYIIDAYARYFFFIYLRKRKKINVVTDRYAYDIMLNEHTYGLTRRFIVNFYPRPDMLLYLYNSPEKLFARKGQHGTKKLSADMRILESVIDDLSARKIKIVKIKTDDINETMERIYDNLI